MFQIGDKIVYPMHGAGTIVDIEEKKILGEIHNYYILQMLIGEMKVMLPMDHIEQIGIRNISSSAEADEIIEVFRNCQEDENNNWNQRYRDNIDKLRGGKLSEIAFVTKTLTLRDKKKSLSNAERKMLNNAKNILVSELVLAKNSTHAEIENLLFSAL